jgi:hypothetical protein
MRRREFIAGLGGIATWPFNRPLAAEVQRRVGVLLILNGNTQSNFDAFRHSAGSKVATCGLIIASPAAIPAVSLRMRRNW